MSWLHGAGEHRGWQYTYMTANQTPHLNTVFSSILKHFGAQRTDVDNCVVFQKAEDQFPA